MLKKILIPLILPLSVFSQDTLFNKTLSNITVKSGKKESVVSVVNIVRNSSSVSDGVSIGLNKKDAQTEQ